MIIVKQKEDEAHFSALPAIGRPESESAGQKRSPQFV